LDASSVFLVGVQSSFLGCWFPPAFGIAVDIVTRSLIAATLRRRWLARGYQGYLLPVVVFVSTFAELALGLDGRIVGGCDLCWSRSRGWSWDWDWDSSWRWLLWLEGVATTFRLSLPSLVRPVSPVTLIVFLPALTLSLP